ncbi:MAG TPA: hypothetical protein VMJ32_02420 [Pirellulales bacterium]|nr:hypothetical protein [Pirellulales bacterium]
MNDKRSALAYHEAGHAVVALQFEFIFRYICIDPPKFAYSKMVLPKGSNREEKTKRMIVITFAGRPAQCLYDPENSDEQAAHDEYMVELFCTEQWGSEFYNSEEAHRMLCKLRDDAEQLVHLHADLIGIVAKRLLENARLTYDEVKELL